MSDPKVISLRVRPLQVAHLCFEVNGILGLSNVQLGSPVKAFDFEDFYANLGQTVPGPNGDNSRLVYDAFGIQNDLSVAESTLVALRAESSKAVLDRAVNARQNAYYAKYLNAAGIIQLMRTNYSFGAENSKSFRLQLLAAISAAQDNMLRGAYNGDGRAGVVKTTTSALQSQTTSTGTTNTQNNAGGKATTSETVSPNVTTTTDTSQASTVSDSSGSATQNQTITNTDYGYRIPIYECQAQDYRAQISLMDQLFSQFMYSQNLPFLETVFSNELQSIDLDVKRLQVAYLNTILLSPIDGIVTGIYKNLGDCVRAGEPVIRVESNSTVILVATLAYRGLISIGSNVTVQTTLFDSSSAATSVNGSVVGVRGHRYEDDQWDVLVSCNNIDGSGNPIFPLDYHFDYDDTVVAIA
jgi:hypothetical protein